MNDHNFVKSSILNNKYICKKLYVGNDFFSQYLKRFNAPPPYDFWGWLVIPRRCSTSPINLDR
jgi:hypothetical protein